MEQKKQWTTLPVPETDVLAKSRNRALLIALHGELEGEKTWVPAKLWKQREDGSYEVFFLPDFRFTAFVDEMDPETGGWHRSLEHVFSGETLATLCEVPDET